MNLFTYRREGVSLADALGAFEAGAVALVYAPRWCGFARLTGGALLGFDGPVTADAYEVRAFHHTAELRWLRNPAAADGTGVAVVLREAEGTLLGWVKSSREVVTLDAPTTYLLWGQLTDQQPKADWGELATARIGALMVPISDREFRAKARVLLHAVEYVATDEYGSAYVCEERLTGSKVLTESGNG